MNNEVKGDLIGSSVSLFAMLFGVIILVQVPPKEFFPLFAFLLFGNCVGFVFFLWSAITEWLQTLGGTQ